MTLCLLVFGCGPPLHPTSGPDRDKPASHEAAERARAEAKANPEESVSDDGKRWGGWRYKGDRDDCFYVVGRKCFKTQPAACKAAACKAKKKCSVIGGGPATVSCK